MMNYDEEWLISNRNGSYSSSSASFSNLRTYHGIYVRNLNDRYDRFVLLSKLFDEFKIGENTCPWIQIITGMWCTRMDMSS
jgi:Glycogen debranching enzyme